jgi:hypothetical protein
MNFRRIAFAIIVFFPLLLLTVGFQIAVGLASHGSIWRMENYTSENTVFNINPVTVSLDVVFFVIIVLLSIALTKLFVAGKNHSENNSLSIFYNLFPIY